MSCCVNVKKEENMGGMVQGKRIKFLGICSIGIIFILY